MMAAERGGGPGSPPGSPAGASRTAADHSVLVVVGTLRPAELLERVLQQIETGEFWKFRRIDLRGRRSPQPFTIKVREAAVVRMSCARSEVLETLSL